MKFFIPTLEDDPNRAASAWEVYADQARAFSNCKGFATPVYSITFGHDGGEIAATVGSVRTETDRNDRTKSTGTTVSAIVDLDDSPFLLVFSLPPYGGWNNPATVGRDAITERAGFEPDAEFGRD